MYTRLLILGIIAIISSCATSPVDSPELSEQIPSQNPAVQNLLYEVQEHKDYGQYELAKAKLERALRIEPTNAYLWFGLAQINQREQAFSEAKNLAQRAISYARGNTNLQKEIQAFIDTISEI